jgi:hypothetical protein
LYFWLCVVLKRYPRHATTSDGKKRLCFACWRYHALWFERNAVTTSILYHIDTMRRFSDSVD